MLVALVATLAGAPAAAASHADLVARWHLDSETADRTPDDSGHDLESILEGGAAFVPGGRFGNALDLGEPGDSQVYVANSPVLEPAQVSVNAWVRSAGPGAYKYVLGKGARACGGSSYALITDGSGGLVFYVFDGVTAAFSPVAGTAIWDDQWHAVTGTFDGSTVRLWVDGAQVGAGTPTPVSIAYGLDTGDLRIGNYPLSNLCAPTDFVWPGLLDEIHVYDRALSGAEIAELHGTAAGDPPVIPGDGGDGGGPGAGIGEPLIPAFDETAVRSLDSKVRATRRGSRVVVDTGHQAVCAADASRCFLNVAWKATEKGKGCGKGRNGRMTLGETCVPITGEVGRSLAANSAETVSFAFSRRAARALRNEAFSLVVRVTLEEGSAPTSPVTKLSAELGPKLNPTPPSGCDVSGAAPRYARSPDTNRKRVALTFDDGPERNTAKFLDLLRAKKVRATFFPKGANVDGRESLLKREIREGHVIGNHTISHASIASGDAKAAAEIDSATALIRSATGFTPCLFRPPNGAESPALLELVRTRNMTTISADVDPSDWQTEIAAETIRNHVLANVRPGSIVILHEDYSSDSTLAALGAIIDELRNRGYELVTVPELLGFPLRYP